MWVVIFSFFLLFFIEWQIFFCFHIDLSLVEFSSHRAIAYDLLFLMFFKSYISKISNRILYDWCNNFCAKVINYIPNHF